MGLLEGYHSGSGVRPEGSQEQLYPTTRGRVSRSQTVVACEKGRPWIYGRRSRDSKCSEEEEGLRAMVIAMGRGMIRKREREMRGLAGGRH